MTTKYDWVTIARRRTTESWEQIAASLGVPSDTLRGCFSRWKKRTGPYSKIEDATVADAETITDTQENTATAILTKEQISRITSLDDLLMFFKVDRERWTVSQYKVNKWEQNSVKKGLVPLYQVNATLVPSTKSKIDKADAILSDMLIDAAEYAPIYPRLDRPSVVSGDPVLFAICVMDPHIGMLAWGKETGEKYDSDIAVRDYASAFSQLLRYASLYPVERILIVAGNDFLHVDGPAVGSTRGGSTTAGTPQDIDSRLAKMFTTGRRALVSAIDQARLVAAVDVEFCPGNHDRDQTYKMGEVIAAWYRNCDDVNVRFGPQKRSYYGYGKNAIMLTHGEEYRRQRDSLPLIFSQECPAKLWVQATHREILTGHNHINLQGRYYPTSEASETRAIRTRSLPGLTATDAWHAEQGYKHQRTATVIAYRKSGGVAGLHEVHP